MAFSAPANLPSQTTVTCTPEFCLTQTIWNGSAIGGTVGMGAQDMFGKPISLTGGMTGGMISGFYENCEGIVICYANEWQFDFTFRGVWNNGCWSEGSGATSVW
jgi:hypothetical protein